MLLKCAVGGDKKRSGLWYSLCTAVAQGRVLLPGGELHEEKHVDGGLASKHAVVALQ